MTSPLDLNAESFLPLYWTLCAASLGAAWFLRRSLSPPPRRGLGDAGGEPSEYEVACLAGGKKRAFHAAVASLVAQGDLRNEGEILVRVDPAASAGGTSDRSALERAVLRTVGSGRADLSAVEAAVSPELEDLHASLRARGLVQADYSAASGCWLAGLPALLVLGFGITKIIVGLGRGKPVGYLLGSCILLAIWSSGILTKKRWLTPAGKAKLKELRTRHAALSKPDPTLPTGVTGGSLLGGRTIPLAVGLFGGAVLAGTAWASLESDFQRREKLVGSGDGGGSSSGGSDGGSSDGGSGDSGGGGCGGCGGGGGGGGD